MLRAVCVHKALGPGDSVCDVRERERERERGRVFWKDRIKWALMRPFHVDIENKPWQRINDLCSCSPDNFLVHDPRQAVLTSPGEGITLRCWLEPGVAADGMYVQWIKYETGQLVLLYTYGVDRPDLQGEAYGGRTELSRGALTRGIISLRLRNVRCSDQGRYTYAHGRDFHLPQTAAPVSLARYPDSRNKLTCKSKGWYPKPRVVWIDGSGGEVKANSDTCSQASDGCWECESSIDITSDFTDRLTCLTQNAAKRKEAKIRVSGQWEVWRYVNILMKRGSGFRSRPGTHLSALSLLQRLSSQLSSLS
uniref:Myelin-oligodendrocyte glycoprotein-like n=1 Tax=Callorhinchus milii TaxID=7868 RepID=A0A4W3HBN0_CALMI